MRTFPQEKQRTGMIIAPRTVVMNDNEKKDSPPRPLCFNDLKEKSGLAHTDKIR